MEDTDTDIGIDIGTTSDIPKSVQNVLLDLDYLSKLPSGKKLNISLKQYSSLSIYDSIKRLWWKEDRYKTITWINSLIDNTIEVGKEHKQWIPTLVEYTKQIEPVINNLLVVYSDEPQVIGQLNLILVRINKKRLTESFKNDTYIQ